MKRKKKSFRISYGTGPSMTVKAYTIQEAERLFHKKAKAIRRKLGMNKRRKTRRVRRNEALPGPYYVWMTDKFMSGWGQAQGRLNKYVVRCDTLEQAECIYKNAQMRDEMKNINYGRKLPYFSESKYKVTMKTWDQLGYVWKTGCKWQNEDDYYADPRRMSPNRRRGLRRNPYAWGPDGYTEKEVLSILSRVAKSPTARAISEIRKIREAIAQDEFENATDAGERLLIKIDRFLSTSLRRNPMRRTVSKVGLMDFIEDAYYNDRSLPENKKWLKSTLAKIKKLKGGVYDIQVIQNMLRDLRDADRGNNDNYWYLVIDKISSATGIGPE